MTIREALFKSPAYEGQIEGVLMNLSGPKTIHTVVKAALGITAVKGGFNRNDQPLENEVCEEVQDFFRREDSLDADAGPSIIATGQSQEIRLSLPSSPILVTRISSPSKSDDEADTGPISSRKRKRQSSQCLLEYDHENKPCRNHSINQSKFPRISPPQPQVSTSQATSYSVDEINHIFAIAENERTKEQRQLLKSYMRQLRASTLIEAKPTGTKSEANQPDLDLMEPKPLISKIVKDEVRAIEERPSAMKSPKVDLVDPMRFVEETPQFDHINSSAESCISQSSRPDDSAEKSRLLKMSEVILEGNFSCGSFFGPFAQSLSI